MPEKDHCLSNGKINPYYRFMSGKAHFITLEFIPGPSHMQGYMGASTSIYIDEKNGQPYKVSIRGSGQPAGESTLAGERMELSSKPCQVTYEELIALAEKAYPGIGKNYEGMNETNWRNYQEVHAHYLKCRKPAQPAQAPVEKEPGLRELFIDYCEIDDLKIVRILNFNIFYAIMNRGTIADTISVYYLNRKECEKLKNNQLTANELFERHFLWEDIDVLETKHDKQEICALIRQAKQKGFHHQCPECHTIMDAKACSCPHCGKTAEKDDEAVRMQYSFQQLREACIRNAELEYLKSQTQC